MKSPTAPSLVPAPRGELPTAVEEGRRVLVVDDSPTILKLVVQILAPRGYDVVTARDGVEALERLRSGAPVDLVLVDFAMPRMNGYQLCRALRSDPELALVPVVLTSARTAAVGERFVEQTGAVEALPKPFDPRTLVATVGRVLERRRMGDTLRRKLPSPADVVDEEAGLDEAPSPPNRHDGAVARFASQLAHAIGPHLGVLRHTDLPPGKILEDALVVGLGNERLLGQLAATLDEAEVPLATSTVFRGDSELLPVGEILQLCQMRRQTGVLRVHVRRKAMVVAMRDGEVDLVFARGCGDEYRLGRYLTRLRLLPRDEVERAIAASTGNTPLGEWLVREGKLDPDALQRALAAQSSELVYELIRWPRGRYTLTAERFWPEAEKARLGLGLGELVLEGFRRLDEWKRMADTLDVDAPLSFDSVALGRVKDRLGPIERRVAELVDGTRSPREILAATDLAPFDVFGALYRMVQAKVAVRA